MSEHPGRPQHDPYGTFLVTTQTADHPITRGLEAFETTDELYTCLIGTAPIEVLAGARSVRDGKQYPLAFVTSNNQRRVFHCVLGHDVNALQNVRVAQLYRRATPGQRDWCLELSR